MLAISICVDQSDNIEVQHPKTICVSRDASLEYIRSLSYYANNMDLKRALDEAIESFSKKDMYMIEWRNRLNV